MKVLAKHNDGLYHADGKIWAQFLILFRQTVLMILTKTLMMLTILMPILMMEP